jgi:hypothetical protein
MSEDAGIEPRTVATLALAVRLRRSNHSSRSHPLGWISFISARSHLFINKLGVFVIVPSSYSFAYQLQYIGIVDVDEN